MNKTDTHAKRVNPFFEDYGTLHYTVPFHKIKTEDYEEAFMEASAVMMKKSTSSLMTQPHQPLKIQLLELI